MNVTLISSSTKRPVEKTTGYSSTTYYPICEDGVSPMHYNSETKLFKITRIPNDNTDIESALLGSGSTWIDLSNLNKHILTIESETSTLYTLLKIEFAIKNAKIVKVKFFCPKGKIEETDPIVCILNFKVKN